MARNRRPSSDAAQDIFAQSQQTNIKAAIQEANYLGKSRVSAALKAWKAQKEQSLFGGSDVGSTKAGRTLRFLGAKSSAEFIDTMFGKKKPQHLIREEQARNEQARRASEDNYKSGVVKSLNQINGTLNAVKMELGVVRASVIDMRRSMGDIGQDVTDIKTLIMPRNITAKGGVMKDDWGRDDKSNVGRMQFAQYNPLAPAGAQFLQQNMKQLGGGFFTRGGLTSKQVEPAFIQDAIKQASMQTAILTVKIQKRDAAKAELKKKNMYSDPAERKAFETDPIMALRDEMMENFKKLFDLLKGLQGGEGDGGFGIPPIIPPIRPRGPGSRRPKVKGGRKPPSAKAIERYKKRFGARAARNRFGGPKRGAGGLFGVGAIAGGYLGYKAVESFRDMTDEEHINPELMKEDIQYAVEEGDVDTLRKNREQIAKQKKDIWMQGGEHAAGVAGAVAGNLAGRAVWKLFVNFVKRRAPAKLVQAIGTRLATAGIMATVPVFGWIGTIMTLGFSAWMAWDIYQLWKEFNALSDAEKEAYTDEAVALDEKKDDPNVKPVPLPDYEMARSIEATATKSGPTSRGGRRGRGATTPAPTPAPTPASDMPSKPAATTGVLTASQTGQVSRGGRKAPSSTEGKKYVMDAMDAAGITGSHRASLLAQLHHESNGFKRLEENLNYSADRLMQVFPKYYKSRQDAEADAGNPQKIAMRVYGKRSDLGNSSPEDGWKYRGRGFIQLTGKSNYKQFGDMIGMDLVNNPSLAAHPQIAAKLAVAYYKSRVIDKGIQGEDVKGVTKAIQGGSLGLEERGELTAMYSGEAGATPATALADAKPVPTHKGTEIDSESRQVAQGQQQAPVVLAMNTPAPAPAPAPQRQAGPLPLLTLSGMSEDKTILNMADSNHALA